jgi:hypothetical protein
MLGGPETHLDTPRLLEALLARLVLMLAFRCGR